jgi:hypothetical protein
MRQQDLWNTIVVLDKKHSTNHISDTQKSRMAQLPDQ